MKCSKCGAEIPNGFQFCGQCGNKVETTYDRSGNRAFAYLCPICKTPNPKSVNYCVKCGHWLLDSHFEAIPLSEQQYYQYINQNQSKSQRPCKGQRQNVNIVVPIIIYTLYFLILISAPLVAKVFFALFIIPYGIINICVPLRKMLIPKRFIGIIITVFGLILSICLLSYYSPATGSTLATGTASSATININQFKSQCTKISYSDLAHSTEKYINKKVAITGQVVQVQETGSSVILRVNMTKDKYGVYENTIWINYTMKSGDSHIIQNDIINIWGSVKDRKTYSTILGGSVTLPEIDAVDIEESK